MTKRVCPTPARDDVRKALKSLGGAGSVGDIASITGRDRQNIGSTLFYMSKDGEVRCIGWSKAARWHLRNYSPPPKFEVKVGAVSSVFDLARVL